MTTREEMLKRKQLAKDIYWIQNSGEVSDSKINKMYKLIGDKINGDLSDEDYIYDELKSISNADIEKISKQIDRLFESTLKEETDLSSYLLKIEKSLHGRDLKTYFNIIKKYGWKEEKPGDGMNMKGQGWNTWIKSLSNKEKEKLIDEIEFNLVESTLKEEAEEDSFNDDISDKLIISLKKSGKLSPNTTLKQFSDALNRNPIYKSLIKRISSGSANMKIMLPFYILIDTISDLESLSLDYKESTESVLSDYLKEIIKNNPSVFKFGSIEEIESRIYAGSIELKTKNIPDLDDIFSNTLFHDYIIKRGLHVSISLLYSNNEIAEITFDRSGVVFESTSLKKADKKENIDKLIEEYIKENDILKQMLPGYFKVGKKLKISKSLKGIFDNSVLENIEKNIELPVDITLVTNSSVKKEFINFSISCQSGKDKFQQKDSVVVAFNNLKIKYSCHIRKEEKTQHGIILWCYSTKISNALGEAAINEEKTIEIGAETGKYYGNEILEDLYNKIDIPSYVNFDGTEAFIIINDKKQLIKKLEDFFEKGVLDNSFIKIIKDYREKNKINEEDSEDEEVFYGIIFHEPSLIDKKLISYYSSTHGAYDADSMKKENPNLEKQLKTKFGIKIKYIDY